MSDRLTDEEMLTSLGVDIAPAKKLVSSPKEQRIIAGFEEIVRFTKENGRSPQHGVRNDIFERIYAERLDQIRGSEECRRVLEGMDAEGLLDFKESGISLREEVNDEELLSALGAVEKQSDISKLTHVKPRAEIRAAEEVAKRDVCEDFAVFRPLFETVQKEIVSGDRRTIKFKDNAEVSMGDLFILDGQKIYVAEIGELFVNNYERPDRRLRVIYDNGTQNEILLRSLQRGLNKDKASRRITDPSMGPLFTDEDDEGDLAAGYIYVLRSLSDDPFIAENRTVIHKIGVTGGDVKKRLVNAKKDPTYLMADVEIVQTFMLENINRKKLEALLHKFFADARLDLVLKDRFGYGVKAREWFLLPLSTIHEAMEKVKDGSLAKYRYDPDGAKLVMV